MAKDYAAAFYKSKAWTRCRNAYMKMRHYICERCGSPAVICHHKTHISPENIWNPDVTLSFENLEALCQDCHNREHMNGNCCEDGLMFDKFGNLVQSPRSISDDDCPRTEGGTS